jgi:N-sulfoglucosamine sulfohydrolase
MRLLAALLAAAACLSAAPQERPAKRNVLFIVADDLGLDLGCYGSFVRTPNLDRLAQNGTRFTHSFATVASCSASRAVILTGLYTHSNGQYGHAHHPYNFHTFAAVRSLPKVLRESGYRTGVLGKLHVNPPAVYTFDVEKPGGDVTGIAEEARKFFAEAGEKPFFLHVGFHEPHRAGKGFGNERAKGVPPERYEPKDVRLPYFLPDIPEAREEIAEYAQAVSRMDRGVGLVLDALREAKQEANTLVVFLSDNGIPFPGAKTTQYEAGLRLPLLISSPAAKRRGTVTSAMVNWADLAPTALDWAGVKAPVEMPGRSILPVLEEEAPKGWDTVFGSHVFHETQMYYPMRTIRTRTHKLILNLAHPLEFPFASDLFASKTWQAVRSQGLKMMGERSVAAYVHRAREELFDLEKDPNELVNLAGDPKQADVLADLRTRLKEWQEKTKDPWLSKYTYE